MPLRASKGPHSLGNRRTRKGLQFCLAVVAIQLVANGALFAVDIAGTRFHAEFRSPSKAEEIAAVGLPFRQPGVTLHSRGTTGTIADSQALVGPRLESPKELFSGERHSGQVVASNGSLEYVPGNWHLNAGRYAMLAEEKVPSSNNKTSRNESPSSKLPGSKKKDPCASERVDDIKPMTQLGADVHALSGPLLNCKATEGDTGLCCEECERCWPRLCYCFAATAMHHNPLYFEEVNLERYGYGCSHCLQTAASVAHFFVRVPALPYMMAVDCPQKCIYTLGHYRPGNCVPWRRHCGPF